MRLLYVVLLLSASSAFCAMPYTFDSGTVAKASHVNANMVFLLNKIDSISGILLKIDSLNITLKKIDSLKTNVDSLQNVVTVLKSSIATLSSYSSEVDSLKKTLATTNIKVDSLKTSLATLNNNIKDSLKIHNIPIGTIIGTMTAMDTSSGTWVIADGRTSTTEYFVATGKANIPDLRGQFLRGLNADRSDGEEDPDGSGRIVGSYQADTIKSHNHKNGDYKYLLECTGKYTVSASDDDNTGNEPNLAAKAEIQPFGGLETRPRNTAVYWYIKIK
jgi:hypothetical protein